MMVWGCFIASGVVMDVKKKTTFVSRFELHFWSGIIIHKSIGMAGAGVALTEHFLHLAVFLGGVFKR